MRYLSILTFLLIGFNTFSQTSLNMSLAYQWNDTNVVPSSSDNRYNEVWGYASNGREYAIVGSRGGTHIFDITDVNNVDTVYYIPGKFQGSLGGGTIHRDYDTYKDYLYIVCDEGASSLQIADLSLLPDSAPLVYDADSMIIRSHNVFVDTASGYLYSCGGENGLGVNELAIYDLTIDPKVPELIVNCKFDIPSWTGSVGYLHDIYVKNDTAYCNAGNNGLFIMDFSNLPAVTQLGSLTSYVDKGYNHSGWLHESGDYYAFADETHAMKIKVIDVSALPNINVIDTISSNVVDSVSIAHNLIFNGDNLFVSYYFDGVYVFNTADPNNISLAGFYDTSTRPHIKPKYDGCWGVYPFLPSGKILATDRAEGLFVFDVSFPLTIADEEPSELAFVLYPNPTASNITVTTTQFKGELTYSIINLNGKKVQTGKLSKFQSSINVANLASGVYSFSITEANGNRSVKKFVKY